MLRKLRYLLRRITHPFEVRVIQSSSSYLKSAHGTVDLIEKPTGGQSQRHAHWRRTIHSFHVNDPAALRNPTRATLASVREHFASQGHCVVALRVYSPEHVTTYRPHHLF